MDLTSHNFSLEGFIFIITERLYEVVNKASHIFLFKKRDLKVLRVFYYPLDKKREV